MAASVAAAFSILDGCMLGLIKITSITMLSTGSTPFRPIPIRPIPIRPIPFPNPNPRLGKMGGHPFYHVIVRFKRNLLFI